MVIVPKILIVEDHADTARTLSRLLRMSGFEVEVADGVQSALHHCELRTFDLLISDIMLPDGNGHDLMREVVRRRPIRGIALSGYGSEDDVRDSVEAGFVEHLTKPVSYKLLEASISRVLKHGNSSGNGAHIKPHGGVQSMDDLAN